MSQASEAYDWVVRHGALIDAMLPTGSQATGDMLYASSATGMGRLAIGATDTILSVQGGVPTWRTPANILTDLSGQAGAAFIFPDDIILNLGSTSDISLLNRSTSLTANTALAGVFVGTPIVPALAANSGIISNVTADGDIVIATQTGGNSQANIFIDASVGSTHVLAAGVSQLNIALGRVNIYDDIILQLGTSGDQALLNRSATLTANTALASVLIGTPVTPALAANSLIISNITADGDILIAGNDGGNSKGCMFFDSSTPDLYLYNVGGYVDSRSYNLDYTSS